MRTGRGRFMDFRTAKICFAKGALALLFPLVGHAQKNSLVFSAGFRASVIVEQNAIGRKSFYEYLGGAFRYERQFAKVNRIYTQYLYGPGRSVTTDSYTTDFTDHDISLGYKRFFGRQQAFLFLGGNYVMTPDLTPQTSAGISFGGGISLPLGEEGHHLVGLTTQYTILRSLESPLNRRSFWQSVDYTLKFGE
jgi:hypothetical protein